MSLRLADTVLLARQPFARNDAVGAFGAEFGVDQRADGRELHSETSVVLEVDDAVGARLDLGAPVEHVAQQVNAVPVDQAFLDRLKEFDLLVGVNAVQSLMMMSVLRAKVASSTSRRVPVMSELTIEMTI